MQLRVGVTRNPKSGRFVRASGTAPASFIRWTTGESVLGSASANATTPFVVGLPTRSMFS